jgi:hypothetical protein
MDNKTWGHDELAHDLAEHLRANTEIIAWENMQMGPSGSPRPDVYTMRKSFVRFAPMAYEVKVSVSDFRSDITSGKWQSYLKYAGAVVFAVPAGLINKAAVPVGCGLIVRHESGWRTSKGPTMQRLETLSHEAWVKLMIDGIDREVKRNRAAAPRECNAWLAARQVRKKHGDRIGELLSDLSMAEGRIIAATDEAKQQADEIQAGTHRELKWAKERIERSRDSLDSEYRHLARELGLGADVTVIDLAEAIRTARRRLTQDAEVQRLRSQMENIQRALSYGLEPLPGEANDNTPRAAGALEQA